MRSTAIGRLVLARPASLSASPEDETKTPRPCRRALTLGLAIAFAASPAAAKDLFDINVDVTTPTQGQGAASATTITDLVHALQTTNLQSLVGSYTDTSAASAVLNIRGVTALASFDANSTTLHFSVPSAGVNQTFTGATRNDSEQQLLDFLLKNGGSEATAILQADGGEIRRSIRSPAIRPACRTAWRRRTTRSAPASA